MRREQSRLVADWTLSLCQPMAYGLLDQPPAYSEEGDITEEIEAKNMIKEK